MPDEKREIQISCKAATTAKIEELSEFQGDIKSLSPENAKKLRRSILRYGFTAPIFVWMHGERKDILDGHQRLAVLKSMQEDGYKIPMIPVDYIEAKTKSEAQRRLLLISSQYGKFEKGKLEQYIESMNESIEDIVKEVEIPSVSILEVGDPLKGNGEEKHCENCGATMHRRYNGKTMESIGAFKRRKYCSTRCASAKKHENKWSANHEHAQKHKLDHCESCGIKINLHGHHIEEDVNKNEPEDIQTLCEICHGYWHNVHRRLGLKITTRMPKII